MGKLTAGAAAFEGQEVDEIAIGCDRDPELEESQMDGKGEPNRLSSSSKTRNITERSPAADVKHGAFSADSV